MRALALLVCIAACGSSSGAIPDSGPCVADPTPPGGSQCPPECTSCLPGNICHIECGQAACNDCTITCPANYACELACNGIDACDTAVVECPAAYPCSVACTLVDSCGDLALHCGKGTCTMTCNGTSGSCTGAAVDCGTGGACSATCMDTTNAPTLDCAGACGCTPCP